MCVCVYRVRLCTMRTGRVTLVELVPHKPHSNKRSASTSSHHEPTLETDSISRSRGVGAAGSRDVIRTPPPRTLRPLLVVLVVVHLRRRPTFGPAGQLGNYGFAAGLAVNTTDASAQRCNKYRDGKYMANTAAYQEVSIRCKCYTRN